MSKAKLGLIAVVFALMVGLLAPMGTAQEQRGGDRGQARQGRGEARGNFDPAAMRERMNQRYKEALGVSDEEWAVLQPRIEKVQQLQMQNRGGMMGGRGMGGRFGNRGDGQQGGDAARPQQAQSPVASAAAELRAAVDDKASSPETIKAKLEALRAARDKARQELASAQEELRGLVDLRQEAQLVMMGVLD